MYYPIHLNLLTITQGDKTIDLDVEKVIEVKTAKKQFKNDTGETVEYSQVIYTWENADGENYEHSVTIKKDTRFLIEMFGKKHTGVK
jgi:phage-related protein